MKTEFVGAKIYCENGTWIQDSLVIEDSHILGVGKKGERRIDLSDCLIFPGIVDLHGDAFERLIMPRPSAVIPYEIGFAEADRQIVASGITTAYFSMSYTWEQHDVLRRESGAPQVMDAYQAIKDYMLCDPKLHLRFEIYHLAGLNRVQNWMEQNKVDLLAFNDHLSYQEERINKKGKLDEVAARYQMTPEQTLEKIKEIGQLKPSALDGVETLAAIARQSKIAMASHDEEEPEVRQWYHQQGCTLCEFPCNKVTAKEALRLGDDVLLGAPNALRGGSLYERMSVRNCVSNKLATVLTSDYYYPSMLQAVFLMDDIGLAPLEELWPLISENAAKAAGLNDRGLIKEGLRADLTIVEKQPTGFPNVVATIVGGKTVYASKTFFSKNSL